VATGQQGVVIVSDAELLNLLSELPALAILVYAWSIERRRVDALLALLIQHRSDSQQQGDTVSSP
jgi:hypothetical protein